MSKDSSRLPQDNQDQEIASLRGELERARAELLRVQQLNSDLQTQLRAAQDRVRAMQPAQVAEAVRVADRYNPNRAININEFYNSNIHPLQPQTLDFIIKLSNDRKNGMVNGSHLERFLHNSNNYSAANAVYDPTTGETWLMQTIKTANNIHLIQRFFNAINAKDYLEVNKQNNARETALFYAVRRMLDKPDKMGQSKAIVECILGFIGHTPEQHIADIELANNEGKTILDLAIEGEAGTGCTKAFAFLISKYSREALVRMRVEEKQLNAGMRRILEEHKEFLRAHPAENASRNRRSTLLKEGSDGRIATDERIRSLKAQILGEEEITKQSDLRHNHSILDYMYDVDTKETLLMLWAKNGNIEANIYFQPKDIDKRSSSINERDINGNTALHLAVLRNYPVRNRVQFLLDLSPDLTIRNNEGKTVLDIIKNRNNVDLNLFQQQIEEETLRQEEAKKSAVAPEVRADIARAVGAPLPATGDERAPIPVKTEGAVAPQGLVARFAVRRQAGIVKTEPVKEERDGGAAVPQGLGEGLSKEAEERVAGHRVEGGERRVTHADQVKRERGGFFDGPPAQRMRR